MRCGTRSALTRVALLRSAPGQGVSRPPHAASRDCRNGSPLARAIPCAPAVSIHGFFTRCRWKRVAGLRRLRAEVVARPPASSGEPENACTGIRGHAGKRKATRISVCAHTRSAASRAGMAWWAGEGGGRFGERREYEAPTLPSTPRQHGAARHSTRQARNSTQPPKPGKKQHAMPTRHSSPPNTPDKKRHATPATRNQPPSPGPNACQPATTRVTVVRAHRAAKPSASGTNQVGTRHIRVNTARVSVASVRPPR